MHDILRGLFLNQVKNLSWKGKKKVNVTRSTSTLTTVEFEEYLEKIRRWSVKELGCYIPNPNEPPSWTENIN